MARGKKTGGRKKGTPNKSTAAIKDQWLEVFEMVGGRDGLAQWAKKNRTMYYRLLAGMLPKEITGADGAAITQNVTVVIKRERSFFGNPATGAIAAPDPDSGISGAIQDGGVRAPVGQNGDGAHGGG